jgi:hypothetical protein
MSTSLDQLTAKRIIHSLLESGQPPKLGATFLNEGTQSKLNRLKDDYLDGILKASDGRDGAGVCKWVVANYGNGKTQFLRCLQELAWNMGYVTAFVELSQDECPLDRPDRVYSAIARSIQATPHSAADIDRGRGIEVMFQQLLDRLFPGVLSGLADESLKNQAIAWVESSLGNTPVESTGFRTAVVRLLTAKLRGDGETASISSAYLRGDKLAAAELKSIGLYEKLDKASGFIFLRSMCQLIQRSELGSGTVLLFDEARRSLSLMSTKQKQIACENLLSVINRCNSEELPGTMFVYAVMPIFFTDFAVLYPALQQRCGPNTKINLEADSAEREIQLLQRIGSKIVAVFRIAYPDLELDDETCRTNIEVIARESLRENMGTGTRRLFVKTWTDALNLARDDSMTELSTESVRALMDGALTQLTQHEQSEVEAEGE